MSFITVDLEPDDIDRVAWLCRMAARGCAHENHSLWASQLFRDAQRLERMAEDLRASEPVYGQRAV